MTDVDKLLDERHETYGDFFGHARVSQAIKSAMHKGRNWDQLRDPQKEALEMIAHKVARILNGDPEYADNWTDIIGYARLVEKPMVANLRMNHRSGLKHPTDLVEQLELPLEG
jgi:hypothetical protein